MCREKMNREFTNIIKGLLLLLALLLFLNGKTFEVRAEEQIHVIREASGGLERLEGIEISDQEAEEWLAGESSQNQQAGRSAEQYPFLEYGSDYGYQDMLLRSNAEGRRYLYQELLKGCKSFTVNGADAGIVETTSGNRYSEAVTVDLGNYDLTANEKMEVYFTFRHDNPQFFWLSNSVVYSSRSLIALTYDEYKDGDVRKSTFDEIVETSEVVYQSKISGTESDYEKVLTIHDTLIADIEYSYDTSVPIAHSIAGAMTSNKSAVCEGYAKVMQLMMNCYEIENIYVTGIGNGGGHAWNMVRMNDRKYYWLDATWDDQPYEIFQHRYFLVGNSAFTDHVADTPEGTGTSFLYALPEAAEESYVYDPDSGDAGDISVQKGDLNQDGEVNVFDLTLCMNHIVEKRLLDDETFKAADVNGDGEINIFDLTKIMNYVCEKSNTL